MIRIEASGDSIIAIDFNVVKILGIFVWVDFNVVKKVGVNFCVALGKSIWCFSRWKMHLVPPLSLHCPSPSGIVVPSPSQLLTPLRANTATILHDVSTLIHSQSSPRAPALISLLLFARFFPASRARLSQSYPVDLLFGTSDLDVIFGTVYTSYPSYIKCVL